MPLDTVITALDEQEYEEAPDNPVLDECAGMCFV